MTKAKVSPRFTLKVNGESREIFMSHGMTSVLSQLVGGIDGVPAIGFDQELRDEVLVQLLSERNDVGDITERVSMFSLDVAPDDVVELMEWVQEHLIDFLLKCMTSSKRVMTKNEDRIKDLMPTLDGSED